MDDQLRHEHQLMKDVIQAALDVDLDGTDPANRVCEAVYELNCQRTKIDDMEARIAELDKTLRDSVNTKSDDIVQQVLATTRERMDKVLDVIFQMQKRNDMVIDSALTMIKNMTEMMTHQHETKH